MRPMRNADGVAVGLCTSRIGTIGGVPLMTHLFCTLEPQGQIVEENMNFGSQREQIPEVMYTICRKELVNKALKSEGLENAHSGCGVLRLNGECGWMMDNPKYSPTEHTLFVTVLSSLPPVGSMPCIKASLKM